MSTDTTVGVRLHPSEINRRRISVRSPVLWAVVVGLIARCIYVVATRHFRPFGDNYGYLIRGQYLQAHAQLWPITARSGRTYPDAYWPPVFPAVLAILIELRSLATHLWIGDHVGLLAWVRLGMSVIGAGSIAGLAFIADRLFGRRVAVVTAWFAALFAPMLDVSASLYSESLLVPLMIGATAATIEYRRTRRPWLLITAGVLTGLAALTHSDAVLLVLPLAIALGPARPITTQRLVPLVTLLATVALVITPWAIRNAVKFHAFVPLSTSLGNTMAGTYNDRSASLSPPGRWLVPNNRTMYKPIFRAHPINNPVQDSALVHRALNYIGGHPGYIATVGFWNTLRLMQVVEFKQDQATLKRAHEPPWTLVLADAMLWVALLAALGGCLTQRARSAPKWLWLIPIVMYIAVALMGAATARFRAPLDPFLILLAACAFD